MADPHHHKGSSTALATPKPTAPSETEDAGERAIAFDSAAVIDDFPSLVPIAVRELETIETYLGSLIEQLLADASASSLAEDPACRESMVRDMGRSGTRRKK